MLGGSAGFGRGLESPLLESLPRESPPLELPPLASPFLEPPSLESPLSELPLFLLLFELSASESEEVLSFAEEVEVCVAVVVVAVVLDESFLPSPESLPSCEFSCDFDEGVVVDVEVLDVEVDVVEVVVEESRFFCFGVWRVVVVVEVEEVLVVELEVFDFESSLSWLSLLLF